MFWSFNFIFVCQFDPNMLILTQNIYGGPTL